MSGVRPVFKDLMHSLIGGNAAQGMANMAIQPGQLTTANLTAAMQSGLLAQQAQNKRINSKRIFHGNIEVLHVANGYVINIGTREGYEYTTHIAQTITEVNEIIAAAMVAFQLESP